MILARLQRKAKVGAKEGRPDFGNKLLRGITFIAPPLAAKVPLKAGDMLTVWKFDRPRRSLRDLITMLDDLKVQGVAFHSR